MLLELVRRLVQPCYAQHGELPVARRKSLSIGQNIRTKGTPCTCQRWMIDHYAENVDNFAVDLALLRGLALLRAQICEIPKRHSLDSFFHLRSSSR